MNSSAKMTAVSFLAAAALGAAVFTGCTVGSGTVDDTDGGTTTPKTDSGTSDTGKPDTDGGGTATCESKQQGDFIDAKCQACLAGSCCTELKGCFDIAGDVDAGKVDCNDYSTCIDDCGTKPDAEREACYADCDTTAADGVQTAYDKITACADTNCKDACSGQ
jgi:hypothetical protein